MGLFRKRNRDRVVKDDNNGNKIKVVRVEGEPHGTHFRAICSDMDKLMGYVMSRLSLDNVFRMTEQPFADMGRQFVAGHKVDLNEKLSIVVIIVMIRRRKKIATAYPVYWGGEKRMIEVKKVYEWPIQIEANIEAKVGDTEIRYFATDFFMEREKYIDGMITDANIWMIGYGIRTNPYEGLRIKVDREDLPFKEVSLDSAEIIMPYGDGGVLDDYVVSGRVVKVNKMKVLEEELLEITLENRPLGTLDVIVNRRNVVGDIKEGVMIEAVGWLEGRTASEMWKTLR